MGDGPLGGNGTWRGEPAHRGAVGFMAKGLDATARRAGAAAAAVPVTLNDPPAETTAATSDAVANHPSQGRRALSGARLAQTFLGDP
jgi:hypothetical protein